MTRFYAMAFAAFGLVAFSVPAWAQIGDAQDVYGIEINQAVPSH